MGGSSKTIGFASLLESASDWLATGLPHLMGRVSIVLLGRGKRVVLYMYEASRYSPLCCHSAGVGSTVSMFLRMSGYSTYERLS